MKKSLLQPASLLESLNRKVRSGRRVRHLPDNERLPLYHFLLSLTKYCQKMYENLSFLADMSSRNSKEISKGIMHLINTRVSHAIHGKQRHVDSKFEYFDFDKAIGYATGEITGSIHGDVAFWKEARKTITLEYGERKISFPLIACFTYCAEYEKALKIKTKFRLVFTRIPKGKVVFQGDANYDNWKSMRKWGSLIKQSNAGEDLQINMSTLALVAGNDFGNKVPVILNHDGESLRDNNVKVDINLIKHIYGACHFEQIVDPSCNAEYLCITNKHGKTVCFRSFIPWCPSAPQLRLEIDLYKYEKQQLRSICEYNAKAKTENYRIEKHNQNAEELLAKLTYIPETLETANRAIKEYNAKIREYNDSISPGELKTDEEYETTEFTEEQMNNNELQLKSKKTLEFLKLIKYKKYMGKYNKDGLSAQSDTRIIASSILSLCGEEIILKSYMNDNVALLFSNHGQGEPSQITRSVFPYRSQTGNKIHLAPGKGHKLVAQFVVPLCKDGGCTTLMASNTGNPRIQNVLTTGDHPQPGVIEIYDTRNEITIGYNSARFLKSLLVDKQTILKYSGASSAVGVTIDDLFCQRQIFNANLFKILNSLATLKDTCYVVVRRLTPRETFRMMGLFDEFINPLTYKSRLTDKELYNLAGDSIELLTMVHVMYHTLMPSELQVQQPLEIEKLRIITNGEYKMYA